MDFSDKVEVGYYGGSFFVSPTNTGFVDENGVLIHEFLHSSVGSKVVLGLTSTSASVDECTLTIVKAADIEIQDVERPWEQFVPTQVPKDRVETPAGTMKYVPIEINFSTMQGTQKIEVVYNEKDGYYHLHTADGPVLYVKITQSTQYLDPLSTIGQLTNIGKYFYDENKNKGTCEEYQILHENHPDWKKGFEGNRRVASLYDLIPANADKYLNDMDEWNTGKIVSKGNKVEHWLNGEKVVEYVRGSKEFRAAVAESKYAKNGTDGQPWGELPEGRILLQDHSDSTVSYRNLKIREL